VENFVAACLRSSTKYRVPHSEELRKLAAAKLVRSESKGAGSVAN
jgi:hypothetical protein